MKPENLEELSDEEIRGVIKRANQLLEERRKRKQLDAMEQARALLTSAGLTVDDLIANGRRSGKKAPVYRTGTRYQHPDNPGQVWAGKGKKPLWLGDLEKKGLKPVELK